MHGRMAGFGAGQGMPTQQGACPPPIIPVLILHSSGAGGERGGMRAYKSHPQCPSTDARTPSVLGPPPTCFAAAG